MSLLNGIRGAAGSLLGGSGSTYARARAGVARAAGHELSPVERYAVQRAYYANNWAYEELARLLRSEGIWNRAIAGLRTPARRIVEFYVATVMSGDLPDALPLEFPEGAATAESVKDAVEQVWRWSNWASKKQVFVRHSAMLGDAFIKVVRPSRPGGEAPEGGPRVYMKLLDPATVTDFSLDERDNVTDCRIDVPRLDGDRRYTHTEHWSKADLLYRLWLHEGTAEMPLAQLGRPFEARSLPSMGIDFVPIAHARFQDLGEDRSVGAFWFGLEKIDEVNAEVTRLAQLLFRHGKPTDVLQGTGLDPTGRPFGPPEVRRSDGTTVTADGRVTLGDEELVSLPSGWQLVPTIANLPYDAHRNQVNDMMAELQADFPEMAYSRLVESGTDMSGRAIRTLLLPAIQRAYECRGNLEDPLARAHQMAITIGQAPPALPGFAEAGLFERGDLEHWFERRPVLPVDEDDRREAEKLEWETVLLRQQAGIPKPQTWREAGYSEDEVADMRVAAEEAMARAMELARVPPAPAPVPAAPGLGGER